MNVSRSALQLVELIQSNAVPRTAVQDRPDVLALFHSSGGTAEKMSADRSGLIEAVSVPRMQAIALSRQFTPAEFERMVSCEE